MYHFVGINQPEMSALSQVISSLGYKVSVSDTNVQDSIEKILRDKGITILPNSANNIHDDMIIIKGDNITDENEEIVKANELGIKIYSCGEMIKRFTEMFQSVLVSGCTFKQNTTEMLTYVLANILGCNYILSDGRGYADKENKFICLEADENKKQFLEYNPYYAVITGIDLNYMDYYDNIDEIIEAYNEFGCKAEKMVLANGDDRYTHILNVDEPIFYYGLNDDNDIIAKEVVYNEFGTSFEVEVEGNYYGEFELPIYGKQMLLNVLSVISICYYERLEAKYVSKALTAYFEEVKQFNEININDTIIVDNIVTHPTEIKAIIKGLKQKYPNKKISSIIDINKLPKVKGLEDYLIDILNSFDKNYILEDTDDEILQKVDNKVNLDNISNDNNILMIISNEKDLALRKSIEEFLLGKVKTSIKKK